MPSKGNRSNNFISTNKNSPGVIVPKFKILLFCLGIITVLMIVWLFFSGAGKVITNHNYYATNKAGVETRLRSVLDSVQPKDKLLYEDISDIGCDESNSVGLALRVNCSLIAQKYYEDSGDINNGLRQILAAYAKNGWTENGYANQVKSIPNADLMSKTEGNYLINSGSAKIQRVSPQVYVETIGEDGIYQAYRIKELISDGKIAQPSVNSKIYGLYISETYWSCRENSFIEPRCPTPPSKL